jgi:hypothetical protein
VEKIKEEPVREPGQVQGDFDQRVKEVFGEETDANQQAAGGRG